MLIVDAPVITFNFQITVIKKECQGRDRISGLPRVNQRHPADYVQFHREDALVISYKLNPILLFKGKPVMWNVDPGPQNLVAPDPGQ